MLLLGDFEQLPRARTVGLALLFGAVTLLALGRSEGTPAEAVHAARRVLATSELETDRRWAPIRSRLPARGIVQFAYGPSDDVALAYHAQFALAPVVLTTELHRSPLLLEDPEIHEPKGGRPVPGMQLVYRTPEGVCLWRRAVP